MERKLYSVSNFCMKKGYDVFKFYRELNKCPKYSERLRINKKGEYVIDEEALLYIGDILQIKMDKKSRRSKYEKAEKVDKAAAREINYLIAENERMRAEINRLKTENLKLRNIAEGKVIQKRKRLK